MALADGMSRLMTDDILRKSMATAGKDNVKRFSMEQIAMCWKTLFERNKK